MGVCMKQPSPYAGAFLGAAFLRAPGGLADGAAGASPTTAAGFFEGTGVEAAGGCAAGSGGCAAAAAV
jgi:hypothetical protein